MTIIRDGKKIELTSEELCEAYYEQQKNFYAQDFMSKYKVNEEDTPALVERVERAISHNDSYWESYWLCFEYVAEEEGLEERDEYLN